MLTSTGKAKDADRMWLHARARRLLRRVRAKRGGPMILMYHRIAELASDPWGLAVTPDNFRAQLRALKTSRLVMDMDEFVQASGQRKLPRHAVAITFDDGYLDNLTNALPLLSDEGARATLFLTTGPSLCGARYYWWDELAAMVLDAPGAVRLREEIAGEVWELELGDPERGDTQRRGWRAWHPARTLREAAYQQWWAKLRTYAPSRRHQVLDRLRTALPVVADDNARPMAASELRELAASGVVRLAGHTRDHPDLVEMPDDAALEQMRQGREETEAIAGKPVTGFAYPYGSVDERIEGLAARAGFSWACDTQAAVVDGRTRPFRFPRIGALDQPGINFI